MILPTITPEYLRYMEFALHLNDTSRWFTHAPTQWTALDQDGTRCFFAAGLKPEFDRLNGEWEGGYVTATYSEVLEGISAEQASMSLERYDDWAKRMREMIALAAEKRPSCADLFKPNAEDPQIKNASEAKFDPFSAISAETAILNYDIPADPVAAFCAGYAVGAKR